MSRIYPSKLLLFGEYTVLNGSQALAVPLTHWNGKWTQYGHPVHKEASPLYAYVDWLKSNDLISTATVAHIISDAEEGWAYMADIPVGYGLGSSGAYVAALYDRYITKENSASPSSALTMLSKMEAYFHGSSSGMDPMISYSGEALYKNDHGGLQPVQDPGWPEGFRIYLLDSHQERLTGPLVQTYKEYLKESDFKFKVEHELIPFVDHAIHFYMNGSGQMLEECVNMISQFQREHFSMMIPDPVKDQWDDLIEIPGVYVKFCGAGGGGYFQVIQAPHSMDILPGSLIRIF